MKKTSLLSSAFAFAFMLSSFTGIAQTIIFDYNPSTDFTKYKTYAWLAPGDSVLNRYRAEKLYGGYIPYAANQELVGRGFRMDTLNPDAIFVFDTHVNEITQYKVSPTLSVGIAVAGPGYYAGGSVPVAGGKVTATTLEDGVLVFAMYDTKTSKLVWTASGEQNFKMTDDLQKLIADITTKIFRKYPVKKRK